MTEEPKRCLTCGAIRPNTPSGKRPTKSFCSLKCRPKPPRVRDRRSVRRRGSA